MLSKYLAAVAALATLTLTLSNARANILIDDFSDTKVTWPSNALSNTSAVETNLAGTYNGRRWHLWSFPPQFNGGSAILVNTPPNSYLQYTGDSFSPVFELIYSGASTPANDLNIPVTGPVSLNLNLLNLTIPTSGQLLITATVAMYNGSTYIGKNSSTTLTASTGPETLTFTFPTYAQSEIDDVHLTFQGTANATLQLDSITLSAPEPTTATLLALTALPLLTRRRRK